MILDITCSEGRFFGVDSILAQKIYLSICGGFFGAKLAKNTIYKDLFVTLSKK
jgi:hypothetical protein